MNIIPLKTQLERDFQQIRLAYKKQPTIWHLEKLRAAYALLEAQNGAGK